MEQKLYIIISLYLNLRQHLVYVLVPSFRFHEFFQIQISWMNNWNLFRVNIKCSGWTLNLCFFLWNCCREIAERCRRIYIFTAFFSRDFLAVQSLLSVTFCYLFYSLLICTLLQKQSGPVVNTSSLPDIMLVIKAKN